MYSFFRFTSYGILITVCWAPGALFAQHARKLSLWGQKVVPYLKNFERECSRDLYFPEGMGVINVIRIKDDTDSTDLWRLSVVLDDRYKDSPPDSVAQLGQQIYFIYDVAGNYLSRKKETDQVFVNYLNEFVADRLYTRPPKQQRWAEFRTKKGEYIREEINKDVVGGYPRNTIELYIKRDGTIKTSRPFRE